MLRAMIMAGVAAVGTAAGAQGQTPTKADQAAIFETRAAALDDVFRKAAADGGSFILRYDLGDRTMTKAYGHLDCARTKPMRADALIDSGSITKAFTYAAIYKLVEEGRLKLDDRLGDLFAGVPADKRAITVAQLLDESSGFADFVNPDGTVPSEDVEVIVHDYIPMTKQELLRSAFASPLQFTPGTKEAYSNIAYQLLAAIIEARSGEGYEAYVRRVVLLPAGMTSTGYVLADFRGRVFAEQCKGDSAWGDPVTRGEWKNGVSWNLIGAGGMMSTVDDLRRWAVAASSGKLFRPDIQTRFRKSSFFRPLYTLCATEVSSAAGSNALTLAAYADLPMRKEGLVMVGVRDTHKPPSARTLLAILCPATSAR